VEPTPSGADDQRPGRDLDGSTLARWTAVVVLAGCGSVLLGWLLGIPALRDTLSRTMKANTALSLALFAAALLLAGRGTARAAALARALAVLGTAVGAATFLEYAAGVDLRIDQALVTDARNDESLLHPGRMSPITAAGLAVLGLALVLFPSRGRVARATAGLLSLAAGLIAFVAISGYLYGTSSLYKLGPAVRISQYTAIAILLLSASSLSLWPQGTFAAIFVRQSAGGVVMRRLFLPIVIIPNVLGLLRRIAQAEGLLEESLATALQAAAAIVALGSIAWYLARVVDRMDRKQAQALEENQKLARTAQAAVKIRDEFIGMAAHELRTPLTSLRLQMQLWQKGVEAAKGKEFSQIVQRQADRLMWLVESMLDGVALASGQLRLELRPVELSGLVREAIERLSPQLTGSKTPLQMHLEPRIEVFGDPGRLGQLVDTLLANALKYGAGKPISVELAQPDGVACLVVRDQGIGIDPKDQSRIFDAFERAVPATHYPGLGLGLYLARQIAEAHGAKIEVRSDAGSGSVFTVSFEAASHRRE
jgi:signal transduction histidine kinase